MTKRANKSDDTKPDTFPERAIRLADYRPHPRNYNSHPASQIERLRASLRKFGQPRNIVVWRNMFVTGHGVAQAAIAEGWETLRANVIPDDWPEKRVLAFLAADNELSRLSDPDQVALTAILDEARQFDNELLQAMGYSDTEFDVLLSSFGEATEEDAVQSVDKPPAVSDDETAVMRWDVPDAVWPSDNEWGVPLLDIQREATFVDAPWGIWGATSRKATKVSTWFFYTEDYRYEALWDDPSGVLKSGCAVAAEPNFSCYSNMPPAVALWQIYRKRWIARWWQSRGVNILVDLNVATNHYSLNLLGVPVGWSAFATRGYTARLDDTHTEFEQAQRIAGPDVTPLFVVYGGGKAVKEECQRNGWLWLQEDMDTAKGRVV
jgi:hypothetical protein